MLPRFCIAFVGSSYICIMYKTFQLFTEQQEHKIVWVAILNDIIRKEHPDALQAISLTSVCEDTGTASLIAKDCGYDFRT